MLFMLGIQAARSERLWLYQAIEEHQEHVPLQEASFEAAQRSFNTD